MVQTRSISIRSSESGRRRMRPVLHARLARLGCHRDRTAHSYQSLRAGYNSRTQLTFLRHERIDRDRTVGHRPRPYFSPRQT